MRNLTEDEALELTQLLNQLVVAFGKVSRRYQSRKMMDLATLYLFDKHKVYTKLAKARSIMDSKYSDKLADGEDTDELGQLLPESVFWRMPSENTLLKWRERQGEERL